MFFEENTIDDLLKKVFAELLSRPFDVCATRGKSSEIFGAFLVLRNPRARLSRTEAKGKIFGAIGELLWYLSKDNSLDFIKYYLSRYENESDDNETVYGGYGPRLFNMRGKYNQIENVISILKSKPTSRRAVIQLFDAKDLSGSHLEIPCTCNLQFAIRESKLSMYVSMRSNDAAWGLPHDIFAFTILQEIVARELGVELGTYYHSVASLHLYESSKEEAQAYIDEGFQSTIVMSPMPSGSQFESIDRVLLLERSIRAGEKNINLTSGLEPYWQDIVRLLDIFRLFREKNIPAIESRLKEMNSLVYTSYIEDKIFALKARA